MHESCSERVGGRPVASRAKLAAVLDQLLEIGCHGIA